MLDPQPLRPPTVLPFGIPDSFEGRKHVAAEQVDVLQAQLMGHRAEMQQCQQVADAQPLDALDQLVADGRRTPSSQKAALDEVLVFELPQVEALAQRRLEAPDQARMVLVTGYRLVILGGVEQLVKEIFDVGRIFLGRCVRLGDPDQPQKSQSIGVGIAPVPSDGVPIVVAERFGVFGAEVAQVTETVVAVDHELDGRGTARARDPDRRVRLLDRPRPKVDHR